MNLVEVIFLCIKMSNKVTIVEWDPKRMVNKGSPDPEHKIGDDENAILLLNQPVFDTKYFASLWNNASLRVAVDGGGNRWNDVRKAVPTLSYPDMVTGDFDSINPEILFHFKQNEAVEVVGTPDQDETDFTKALRALGDKLTSLNKAMKILAFCENTGRFDQIMANVETLFVSRSFLPKEATQVYIFGSSSITWLLSPEASHTIHCDGLDVAYCSLIPVSGPSTVTTTGLKWNLTSGTLAFGHLVSTSNELGPDNVDQVVTVESSQPVLWSMERRRLAEP